MSNVPYRLEKFPAKQTVYKGQVFRSRLEARWAVFFDQLGVKYEYEPQAFTLVDGIRYRPDFALLNVYWGKCGTPITTFVEVKGADSYQELGIREKIKIEKFSEQHPLLILGNLPQTKQDLMDRYLADVDDKFMTFRFINGSDAFCFFSVYKNRIYICSPWDEENDPASIEYALNYAALANFDSNF